MAIVMISDAATDTVAQYDDVIRTLEHAGHGNPPGRLSHVAALKGNGYIVIDVWESQEAFDSFAQVLIPLIEGAGGSLPKIEVAHVHNQINGE
jgi:hypothetical protein